jgi:hypothetical protein
MMRTCIQGDGFDANLVNASNNSTRTSQGVGTLKLKQNGSGILKQTALILRFNGNPNQAGSQAASVSNSTCSLNWELIAGGDVKMTFKKCKSKTVLGRGTGGTAIVTGTVLRGRASLDGQVMHLSTFTPGDVENVNSTSGKFKRICARSGTAILK